MSSVAPSTSWQSSALRDRALVVWTALGTLLPCLAPNIGPLVLALSIVAPSLLADRKVLAHNLLRIGPVTATLAVIVLYLCLNVLVAPVTDNAWGAIATIALGGLACHVAVAAFPTVPMHDLRLMGRGLMIGCFVIATLILIEYASHMSILRALQAASEALNVRIIRTDAGTWERPAFTHMSRNLAVLIMLVWAAMAASRTIRPQKQAFSVLLLGVVASAALLSPSATAKAGLLAGVATWGLARTAPRIAAALVSASWIAASTLCIPAAHLIHWQRLYDIDWVGSSLRHRMMIWSASADWFWQHPLLGLGIGGARKVNLNEGLSISTPGISGEPLNWHAHNIFVQAWLETGAIGGLLLCLFGLVLLRAIFRLPPGVRAYAVATFVSIFVIGLAGFSLWAAWYLAGYGLAALCLMTVNFADREQAPLRGSAAG
jgi:exopolysaccharide production protein ExoQ